MRRRGIPDSSPMVVELSSSEDEGQPRIECPYCGKLIPEDNYMQHYDMEVSLDRHRHPPHPAEDLEEGEVVDPTRQLTPPPCTRLPRLRMRTPSPRSSSPDADDTSEDSQPSRQPLRRSSRKRIQRVLQVPSEPPRQNTSSMATRSSTRMSTRNNSRTSSRQGSRDPGESSRKRVRSQYRHQVMSSSDSQLSVEVSIHTRGAAVPHIECPICHMTLTGNSAEINNHVNMCLPEQNPPQSSLGDMVEYEWSGQTRVRATAMLEGGVRAAGLGFGSMTVADDVDVDIDADDETNYGKAQYTNGDLHFEAVPAASILRTTADPQFESSAPAIEAEPLPATNHAGPSAIHPALSFNSGASQLIIDALKERIRQQDRLIQATPKCFVCLEPFAKPCTSINCWHVCCESCWLRTLGIKKVCPQCGQITQPNDLRRIYM